MSIEIIPIDAEYRGYRIFAQPGEHQGSGWVPTFVLSPALTKSEGPTYSKNERLDSKEAAAIRAVELAKERIDRHLDETRADL